MKSGFSPGLVEAVSLSAVHQFSKPVQKSIRLLVGLGVEGDVHHGVTAQHRSRVAKDPTQPNLRQVHLIHEELHEELRAGGFQVAPGVIGENITTRGMDLLALPRGARLQSATGSRNMAVRTLHNPGRYGFVPDEGRATLFDFSICPKSVPQLTTS
jgi:hypothetical protein